MNKKECVVIGGGISGLVSAYELAKRGYKVTILEKENRLGGRLYPFVKGKFRADAGAQLIGENYTYTLNLFKDLGCEKELFKLKEPSASLFTKGKIITLDNIGEIVNNTEILKLTTEIYKIGEENNLSFTNIKNNKLTDLSIADWVLENFDENILEYLIQPSITGLTLTEPEKLSALYGLTLLYNDLKFSFSMKNGLSNVITILTKKLQENNTTIKTNCNVLKIYEIFDDIFRIEYEINNKIEKIDAKNIICSTPAFVTSRILPFDDIKSTLSKIEYSYGLQILIALDTQVWKNTWAILVPRKELNGIAMIVESTLASPLVVPKGMGLMELFIYGEVADKLLKLNKQDVSDFVLEKLEYLFPNINKNFRWCEIIPWNYVLPIHSPHFPEINQEKMYINRNNNIVLAGDYLYLPSIEAAVYSGYEAAKQIETQTQT